MPESYFCTYIYIIVYGDLGMACFNKPRDPMGFTEHINVCVCSFFKGFKWYLLV